MITAKVKFPKRPNILDEKKFAAAFERAAVSATGLAIRIIEADVKKRYPSITAKTKSSIIGDVVSIHDKRRVIGTVGSPEKVAVFLEYGTRPHWAPLAPLAYWAKRKFGNPKLGSYIRRKIAGAIPGKKGGTQAFKYFEKAFKATEKRALSIYAKAFQQLTQNISK